MHVLAELKDFLCIWICKMPSIGLRVEILDQSTCQSLFDVTVIIEDFGAFAIGTDFFTVAIAKYNFSTSIAVNFLSGAFAVIIFDVDKSGMLSMSRCKLYLHCILLLPVCNGEA